MTEYGTLSAILKSILFVCLGIAFLALVIIGMMSDFAVDLEDKYRERRNVRRCNSRSKERTDQGS